MIWDHKSVFGFSQRNAPYKFYYSFHILCFRKLALLKLTKFDNFRTFELELNGTRIQTSKQIFAGNRSLFTGGEGSLCFGKVSRRNRCPPLFLCQKLWPSPNLRLKNCGPRAVRVYPTCARLVRLVRSIYSSVLIQRRTSVLLYVYYLSTICLLSVCYLSY